MASPQKENGFTPIANELLEAFYRCKLLEYERIIVMCIWRKTYGWQKKEDWISNSQFSEDTGLARPHITRTIKSLRERKILTKNVKKLTINKNYDEWLVEWRVTSPGNRVTSRGNKKLPHQVPTKEKKETIQNKLAESEDSEEKNHMFNKYGEDYEEGVIDLDGDGTVEDEQETKKAHERLERNRIKKNLKLIEDVRELPYTPQALNADIKVFQQLESYGWTPKVIMSEYIALCESKYWKVEKIKGKYPTLKTVEYQLRNKQPK